MDHDLIILEKEFDLVYKWKRFTGHKNKLEDHSLAMSAIYKKPGKVEGSTLFDIIFTMMKSEFFLKRQFFDVSDMHGRPRLHIRREGERLQGVYFTDIISVSVQKA